MPNTDWEIRLVNEVSSAAKQAGVDLRALASTVRDVKDHLDGLTKTEKKEGETVKEAKKEHEGFFAEMLSADLVAEGIERVAEKVADLGLEFAKSAIDAADFEYKAEVGLKHMTGSAEVTRDVMERARAFANGVGEDVDEATDAFAKLTATGLRGEQLTAAAAAAKDLGDANRVSFDQTAQLFELIGSDAGLGGRTVRQLKQFPGLLNELEKHFGFVPGTTRSFQQLTKQLDEAPVKGAAGLALLESEIAKVYHENELGDIGVEFGESFEGGIQKIKNDWKEILGDLSHDPAFEDLRKSLSSIAEYFDPATAKGKEFEQEFSAALQPLLSGIDKILKNPKLLADFFGEALEDAKAIGEAAKAIGGAAKAIGGFIHPKNSAEDQADIDAKETAKAKRLQSWFGVPEGVSDFIAGNKHTNEELEKAPSPHELPPLASLPSMDSGGTVDRTGMVTVHEGETIVPAGVTHGDTSNSTTAGGHTFHFEVHVQAGEAHQLDEQMLVAKLNELTPGAIMNALEQMNQMKGGQ